jgi:DNA topoisomerase-3
MGMLSGTQFGQFANEIRAKGWIKPNKRIFNNAKVSDHFAIIPTTLAPKNLDEDEQKIYDFVTRRFLAVFYPAAEFMVTTRITRVEGEPFKSEGKVLVNPGWMAIYGREAEMDDSTPRLVAITPNEQVKTEKIEVFALQTKPPARFSEATLLSAMEGAGKLVEDEELREAMSAKGLGTPATRAAIIEGLILEGYIARQGRELSATAKGISLITLLRGLGIPELCSPELTGNWEFKLKQMERGELQRPIFMREIADMTKQIVQKTKQYESDTVPGDFGTLKTPCPKCAGVVKETYKTYQCTQCDFSMWKIMAGRQLELEETEELLREKKVGPLQGFKSKMGRPFAAIIKMNAEMKPEFDFGPGGGGENGQAQAVDFTGMEVIGQCPVCKGKVFDTGMAYLCENATGPDKKCTFRSGKVILQRNMTKEETAKLLANGKTDLLHKFISKKGRPFSAYLVLGKDGKVSFEFEPRKPKAAGATAPKGKGGRGVAKPGASATAVPPPDEPKE